MRWDIKRCVTQGSKADKSLCFENELNLQRNDKQMDTIVPMSNYKCAAGAENCLLRGNYDLDVTPPTPCIVVVGLA